MNGRSTKRASVPSLSAAKRRWLHNAVIQWYYKNGRSLPWRKTTDPYAVLISEIMLQQTQVSRVLVKFPRFMAVFPTVRRLANGTQRSVVAAWRGMGYNNRAVRLHRLAKIITEEYDGSFPRDTTALRRLPGIGRYTSHAVAAFAFGASVPVVDVNIQRVFSRFFRSMKTTGDLQREREIWQLAEKVLPRRRVYVWNQALMDLGAMICTARAPLCPSCPLRIECRSARRMIAVPPQQKNSGSTGTPDRIYRGRIIEILRSRSASIRSERLGELIMPGFGETDRKKLEQLLFNLQRDGLVHLKERKHRTVLVALA